MQILIEKDATTTVVREVAGLDEARAVQAQGFKVLLLNEDGTEAPLPSDEPETVEAEAPAAEPAPEPVKKPGKKPAKKAD